MVKLYTPRISDAQHGTIQSALDLAAHLSDSDAVNLLFSEEGRQWLGDGIFSFEASEQWSAEQPAFPVYTSETLLAGWLVANGLKHNTLDPKQKTSLTMLAGQVAGQLKILKEKNQGEAERKCLSMVVRKSSNAIIFRGPDGKISWVNEAYERLLGYSSAELVGTNNLGLIAGPQTDVNQIASAKKRIMAGKAAQIQLNLLRKDGSPVSVIGSINPITNDEGTLVSSAAIITDISELKDKEKEIRRLSLVATESPNGVVIRDKDDRILWTNPAFEKIFGYSGEELSGQNVSDLLFGPGTDLKTFRKAVNSRLNNRKSSVEILYYKKDSTPVWIHLQNYPIRSAGGKVESSVTTFTDITDRKRKEEELHMLSMVASKTCTGVIINDSRGKVFWANDAFQRITGYTVTEVSGHFAGDILSGSGTDMKLLRKTRQIAKSKQPYYVELLAFRKDGNPFWVAISGTPVLDEYGRVNKQVEIFEDITDRKAAELELIRTREEAVQLSRAKERFLSVMSHEIRTPLTTILGMAQLLLDEGPKESQLKWLNLLKFAGENLRTMINGILDLTKIETGRLVLEQTDINLDELLSKTITSLQLRADGNGTKLVLQRGAGIPAIIKGDPVRLYQILMNLLGNAIKFTKNGKVTLKVTRLKETRSTVKLRFRISDTGIGIPKDRLNAIFEPYIQAASDTTRKFGGTGLGLTIVRNLLKVHGSDIRVSSVVGKGSTFSFDITFEKASNEGVAEPDLPETASSPLAILVVDDEEINRKIAARILSAPHFDTHFAENGEQALEKIKSAKYDCVLMDLNMPVMSGIEATMALRSINEDYFQNIPVIAVTGSTDHHDMQLIKNSGMNGHIVKPFRKAELLNEIRRLMRPLQEVGEGQ